MNRRDATLAIVALGAAPLTSFAQQAGKVWRIGWLSPTESSYAKGELDALRSGLRDLGYVEGRNIVFESRWANGDSAMLPALARSLAELGVDVICPNGDLATQAAKKATSTIPIVFGALAFPDATGLVASLARPGANITGLAFLGPEYGKRLELLREVSPHLGSVALLYNDRSAASIRGFEETRGWAERLGVALEPYGMRRKEDFDSIFAAIAKRRPSGLMTTANQLFSSHPKEIVEFAARERLLSIFPLPVFIQAGGLMSYGTSTVDMWRQAAGYVDRILKGARPADLPVEQPIKFELVINLKTAKALGIKIPQSILLRADRVIE